MTTKAANGREASGKGGRSSPSRAGKRGDAVVRIAISQAAFEAICATLPLGSVGYENETNEKGERYVWLDQGVVNRLRAMRGPGESYSDVIIRLQRSASRERVLTRTLGRSSIPSLSDGVMLARRG